ncbi:MAG: PAS domain-containing protein [Alphaproteobacteria bacterium]|nr:PAS domain-containing protein [Alphaproteobacteria bacterium]
MSPFDIAAGALPGAIAGATAVWLIAERRRRAVARASQALAEILADERARRIAAEATLRQNESVNAERARAAPAASWEWDIASGDVTWSPAMYSLFGLDTDGAPPSRARFMAMVHAQDRGIAAAWLANLARAETPTPVELRALRADGATRLLRCDCLSIHDDRGQARRLLITVRDVTDLAPRPFAAEPGHERVVLAALIGAAACLVEPEAESAGVALVVSVEPGIGTFAGSDRALTEIILRLLGNAVARSLTGGRVTLRAARADCGDIEIEIADTGPALAEDEIGERSILGQAKALAEREGGTLRVAGTPGLGLAVTIRLPATGAGKKVA